MGDEKLLERMLATKAGWSNLDVDSLLTSFGFTFREAKHGRLYSHSKYPQLVLNVAHRKELAKPYISAAIRLIRNLKILEEQNEHKSQTV